VSTEHDAVNLCRPKREEVIEGWRKLHNEKPHDFYLYSSTNIVRVFKSIRMRWAENVARMDDKRRSIHSPGEKDRRN
jgi:hypothetical protein